MAETIPHKTLVGLRTELTISGEPVAVEAVLGKDFFLQLSQEAQLGTPISFAYWLKETYAVDSAGMKVLLVKGYDTLAEFQAEYDRDKGRLVKDRVLPGLIRQNLTDQGIPASAHTVMLSALTAEISITDLLIDIKGGENDTPSRRRLKFGLAVTFPNALPLLPNIYVNRLSLLILHVPADDKFENIPQRQTAFGQPQPLKEKAKGDIAFTEMPADASKITLGGVNWTFVSGEPQAAQTKKGGTVEETLVALARDLNRWDSPAAVRKCTYTADGKRLLIEFNEGGLDGNKFTIAAASNSKGVVSAATLLGGTDPDAPPVLAAPKKKATGTIKITKLPAAEASLTLNGIQFIFKDKANDAKGPTDVFRGKDIDDALDNLTKKANASDDQKLTLVIFENDKTDTLTITAKTEDFEGKNFALATDAADTFTLSGATLSSSA